MLPGSMFDSSYMFGPIQATSIQLTIGTCTVCHVTRSVHFCTFDLLLLCKYIVGSIYIPFCALVVANFSPGCFIPTR